LFAGAGRPGILGCPDVEASLASWADEPFERFVSVLAERSGRPSRDRRLLFR
jgi:hypothetical protein